MKDQPALREVMILSFTNGRTEINHRSFLYFGLSLTQSSDDWKHAVDYDDQHQKFVSLIDQVNLSKYNDFLNREKNWKLQLAEKNRLEWIYRESFRRRCIQTVEWEFNELDRDRRNVVRALIMILSTRYLFLKTNSFTRYSDVLKGIDIVSQCYKLPWEAATLIVQFYILRLYREDLERNRERQRQENEREQKRLERRRQQNEWRRTSGHICCCHYIDYWGELVRDCGCYKLYNQDMDEQDDLDMMDYLEYDCRQEDLDYESKFPDGDVGEESRNMLRGFKVKTQKLKSRYRSAKKVRPRGERTGKCHSLLWLNEV